MIRRLVVPMLSLASLFAAAPAHADFQFPASPAPLSLEPAGDLRNPSAAIDPTGRVVIAWWDDTADRIRVAERLPGVSVHQLTTLQTGSIPLVGVDAAGNATVAWYFNTDGLRVVRIAADGTVGPIRTVEATTAADASLTVAPNGAALLAWTDGADAVKALYRAPGAASFDATASTLDNVGSNNSPTTAITSAGRLVVAWQDFTNSQIRSAVRTPPSMIWSIGQIFDTTTFVIQPRLAIDAQGVTYVIWMNVIVDGSNEIVQSSRLPANSTSWDAKVDVSPGNEALSNSTLDLAADDEGNVAAIWNREDGGGAQPIVGKYQPPGATWEGGAPKLVTPAGGNGYDGELAAAPGGEGFLAVWQDDPASGPDNARAASRAPGSSAWTTIGSLGVWSRSTPDEPTIAIDPRGNAFVAWAPEGSGGHIQAALGDGGDPPSLSFIRPLGGLVGAPLAFSLTASDFTGIASSSFAFGDGTTASGPTASHAYTKAGSYATSVTATDGRGNRTTVAAAGAVTVKKAKGPVLTGLKVKPKRFAVASGGAPRAAKLKRIALGTVIKLRLSETARVTFTLQHPARGFRKGKRCLKARAKANKPLKRCTRWVKDGALKRKLNRGKNSFYFSGRIGKKPLRAGKHRVVAVPVATDGARGKPSRPAGFTIIRRR